MIGASVDEHVDVSIVMAVYNGMPYLQETLDSLLGQDYDPERFEVIVIDDGSTDESLPLLQRYAEDHSNLVVIPLPHSGSPAGPWNVGIDRARGRYFIVFGADDLLAPYALTDMVAIADANQVDIVVPKQTALGGRSVPIQAFRTTLPCTDIYSSDVYRILGPVKLFRTSFVRDNGFRFPAEIRRKSDVPFGVETYLAARSISVLADRSYIGVRLRDDGGNLTSNRTALRDHMPVVRFVFDTVAERVRPGFKRDRLMVRHFRTEMAKAVLEGFPGEEDEDYRRACFDEFARTAHRYCSLVVLLSLPVRERIVMFLILKGRYGDLCAIAPVLAQEKQARAVSSGRSMYQAYAGFRDAKWGIPDRMYRVGAGSCVQCSAVSATLSSGECDIDFVARILVSNDPITDVRVVRKNTRSGEREVVYDAVGVPVTVSDVRQLEFAVPASQLLDVGSERTTGEWTVRLEASLGGERLSVPVSYLESAKRCVDQRQDDGAPPAPGDPATARLERSDSGDLVVRRGPRHEATIRYPRALRRGARMLRSALRRFL
jgi:glycosyltransferase involved in cell wall biosynthesis